MRVVRASARLHVSAFASRSRTNKTLRAEETAGNLRNALPRSCEEVVRSNVVYLHKYLLFLENRVIMQGNGMTLRTMRLISIF